MKVTVLLAALATAAVADIVNNEASSNPRKLYSMRNVLTCSTAPQDRGSYRSQVHAQDQGRRQGQRPLPRHTPRRQRVRRLIQPRFPLELRCRYRSGHQGLGPGSARHVPWREEEAHNPDRVGLWLARCWPYPRQQRFE
jgi:hypothetical protein